MVYRKDLLDRNVILKNHYAVMSSVFGQASHISVLGDCDTKEYNNEIKT